MRWIIIFFLFPLFSLAQTDFSNWLTPFATVDFKEKEIVFRVAETSPVCELIPVVLLPGEFSLSREPSIHLKCGEIYEGIRQLGAYLENPDRPGENYNDRLRYIKAFALQSFLALSGHGIPSSAVYDKVSRMAAGPDQEIARISGMALRLYKRVENYLKEQYGRVEYYSNANIPLPELDLFSTDRLISTPAKKTKEQITDSIVWPKYYSKEANSDDVSEDIIESYDKGFMMAGNFEMDDQQWSWFIKTDINGNILWEKIFEGGDNIMETNSIYQSMDGGILSCGWIWTSIGKYEPFVMKLNSCGEKEWCKIFTGSVKENPWAQDIIETSEGEIVVLVNQWGTDNIEDLYLFKMSLNGDVLWKKSVCSGYEHPESAIALGWSIIETSDQKYLIAGDVYWEDPWNPGGPKGLRPLFIMTDQNGKEEWVLPVGLQDTIYGSAKQVKEISENNFIGAGSNWPNVEDRKLIIMKFDINGIEINYNVIDASIFSPNFNKGFIVDVQKNDTMFYFGGVAGPVNQEYYPFIEFSTDTNIFNENLNIYNTITHNNTVEPYSLIISFDNKLLSNPTYNNNGDWNIALSKLNLNLEYDTAYNSNYTYDSLCQPGPPQSGFIYLDNCDIITGTDFPSPEEYYASIATIPMTAFSNPAETEIILAFENTEHHGNMVLECYNIYGQKVHTEKIWKGQQETRIDLQGWAKGLYFAVVKSEGKVAGTGKFVRR